MMEHQAGARCVTSTRTILEYVTSFFIKFARYINSLKVPTDRKVALAGCFGNVPRIGPQVIAPFNKTRSATFGSCPIDRRQLPISLLTVLDDAATSSATAATSLTHQAHHYEPFSARVSSDFFFRPLQLFLMVFRSLEPYWSTNHWPTSTLRPTWSVPSRRCTECFTHAIKY
jgi:hypothetical protein